MTTRLLLFLLFAPLALDAVELPDIRSVVPDLQVPALQEKAAAAGLRVRHRLSGQKGADVYHVLYLPREWKLDSKWPVIVEWTGNGGYSNAYGDVSAGRPEDADLGYGLCAGRQWIWLSLPYLNAAGDALALKWWGDAPTYDPRPTLDYAKAAVQQVCSEFSGDRSRVLLCGFSRGAIACGYLGLYDDEMAGLWCGFFAFSHFDGVRQWPYPGADRDSALRRLLRLGKRPLFVCGEGDQSAQTAAYLQPLLPSADVTFQSSGFRNHNDEWLLRPSPARDKAREWLLRTLR